MSRHCTFMFVIVKVPQQTPNFSTFVGKTVFYLRVLYNQGKKGKWTQYTVRPERII